MTEVTIEYCVPCGLRDRAVDTGTALLERFGRDLDAVTLETGHGGVFEVRADGETLWSKESEAAFDVETIGDAVADRVGAEV